MLRSMYTSISGLKNHQLILDVVANNIANVNTYGFKTSRVAFKNMLDQSMQGASAPSGTLGGTNSRSVGLGMQVDSITQIHTQGNLQTTGSMTDLAISGDGFFRVSDGTPADIAANVATKYYTRAGNFLLDGAGDMVTTDGYHVIGYADNAGAPDPAAPGIINIDPATTRSYSIGQNGAVTVIDNAGNPPTIVGWISMSKFPNSAGLVASGSNKWVESDNSGTVVDGTAGDASGLGLLTAGTLEMSNVDLASEFTEMIRAQRGFQANSRIITTSDEILQELVNLKR